MRGHGADVVGHDEGPSGQRFHGRDAHNLRFGELQGCAQEHAVRVVDPPPPVHRHAADRVTHHVPGAGQVPLVVVGQGKPREPGQARVRGDAVGVHAPYRRADGRAAPEEEHVRPHGGGHRA